MNDSQYKSGQYQSGKRAQRGVSLIEVLVVLVILVTGILAIIRLFPSGFFSIESTGNSALADSLGAAAVDLQNQNSSGIAAAILPGPLDLETNPGYSSAVISQYSDYDTDDPNTLDNARRVSNETITIPSRAGGGPPIYVVNYGPIAIPAGTGLGLALSNYLTVNSTDWQVLPGDSTQAGATPPVYPQDMLGTAGTQRCLVDETLGRIAVPTSPAYPQAFVLQVTGSDSKVYTLDFTVPASGDGSPQTTTSSSDLATRAYYPDSQTYYNGGWFDPIGSMGASGMTYKYNTDAAPPTPPTPWKSVVLYRPFSPVAGVSSFLNDPYEFTLTNANLGTGDANVGALAFNPKAAGGNGAAALKAQITYQTYSWQILREDRDVPALSGGNTASVRLSLKNLKRAGDANPDNSIYPGLTPGSNASLVILDLDTGAIIAPGADPTLLNDEDTNGPSSDSTYKTIDVSYSLGRLTLGSNAFGDNLNGAGPGAAHRVRVFYAGDLDWTVAVQDAPSRYTLSPNSANVVTTMDPVLKPAEYAYDPNQKLVYFPHKDANKTVELDGTYTDSMGNAQSFNNTLAISPVVIPLGATNYVSAPLTLPTGAANVSLNTVRGLSTRSVVAWKERNQWKVHTVDAVLTRTP